ncbi:hypothetical protein [Oceanithermus sp.]
MRLPTRYHPLYMLSALGSGGLTVAFWKLGDVTQQTPLLKAGQAFFVILAAALIVVNLPFWWATFKANAENFCGWHS